MATKYVVLRQVDGTYYAVTDDDTTDGQGGGHHVRRAPQAPAGALACAECGTELREPSPNGLCGLCAPEAGDE